MSPNAFRSLVFRMSLSLLHCFATCCVLKGREHGNCQGLAIQYFRGSEWSAFDSFGLNAKASADRSIF